MTFDPSNQKTVLYVGKRGPKFGAPVKQHSLTNSYVCVQYRPRKEIQKRNWLDKLMKTLRIGKHERR
jgi:hypothetical protein